MCYKDVYIYTSMYICIYIHTFLIYSYMYASGYRGHETGVVVKPGGQECHGREVLR